MASIKEDHAFRSLGLSLFLLWPVGFEQFVPVLILLVFLFVDRKNRSSWRGRPFSQIYLAVFTVVFVGLLVSGLGIQENVRLITFLRDVMAWFSAFYIFLYFEREFRGRDFFEATKILGVVFWVLVGSAFIYVVIGSIQFPSLAYLVSPGFIKNSMTGQRFLMKDFGEQLYFYGFTDRVSSFFGSPIHFAAIITLLLPFALFQQPRMLGKIFVFVIAFWCVFYAQARLILVLFVGLPFIYLGYLVVLKPRQHPLHLLVAGFVVVAIAMIGILYVEQIYSAFLDLFFERRAGSAEARGSIYSQSIEWIKLNPIIGYGTQVDVPGLDYPLGSHSTPLGLIFKYGLITASLILAVMMASFWSALRAFGKSKLPAISKRYGLLLACLTVYAIVLLVNEYIVDAYHTVFLFAFMGAMVGSQAAIKPVGENQ